MATRRIRDDHANEAEFLDLVRELARSLEAEHHAHRRLMEQADKLRRQSEEQRQVLGY